MDSCIIAIVSLLVGWLLDLIFGDPARLPHPVVWFGKAIAFFEHRLNKGSHRKLKGALVAVFLIAATYAVGLILNSQLSILNFIIVFYCLAGTTLIREVKEVFRAVDCSLEEGRKQVARIVGRDTSELTAQEVRTAALETLAENLSDGVIAPLFWFAILGVPGMLAYKMVNTLDSMIGYKTERYRDFGCWAAHIDDIANYIPARLTALLMALPHAILNSQFSIFNFIRKNGRHHASPNSGYPEAALAGILNCRFGGPHYYFGQLFPKPYIGENERPLTTEDMKKAVRINRTAEVLMVVLTALCLWLCH
jgi:adenosylcobinamide-phosphate synthase